MHCGRPDVDAFLDELTWDQLEELRAFENQEGFGEQRQDVRFAYMLAVLCCKLGVSAEPNDFLYTADEIEDEPTEMTPEQQFAVIVSGLGARPQ